MAASLLEAPDKDLEEEAQGFIQDEEEPRDPFPFNETQELPKPPIVLKPLPSGLYYAFLNNNRESPVIISDNLSKDETLRLLTVLEKHRSAFGYSLKDLKGLVLPFAPIAFPQIQHILLLGSPNVGLTM